MTLHEAVDRYGSALPFAVFVAHAAWFGDYLIDDAGITFAYARSFAEGAGLVSQPGAPPVEGYSNTLWLLALSPFLALGVFDPVWTPKLLAGMCVGTTYALAWREMRRHGVSGSLRLGVLTLLSLNTPYVLWSISGLENALYGALALGLAAACARALRPETSDAAARRAARLAGGIVTALVMTRPDGLLYLCAVPVGLAAVGWRRGRWRMLVANYGATAGAGTAAFFGFRQLYFHQWLPNTARAKGVGAPALDSLAWFGPADVGLVAVLGLLGAGAVLYPRLRDARPEMRLVAGLAAGAVALIGWELLRYNASLVELSEAVGRPLGWALLLLPLADLVRRLARREASQAALALYGILAASLLIYAVLPPDWMPEFRFATPAIILLHVAAGVALTPWARRAGPRLRAAALGAAVVAQAVHFGPRTQAFVAEPTVPFSAIAATNGHAVNRLADRLGLEDATLLAPDLGGTLWASTLRVYDLAGLCDPTVAATLRSDPERLHAYLFDEVRPTFVITHSVWSVAAELDLDGRFGREYVRVAGEPGASPGGPRVASGVFVRRDAQRALLAATRKRHEKGGSGEPAGPTEAALPSLAPAASADADRHAGAAPDA